MVRESPTRKEIRDAQIKADAAQAQTEADRSQGQLTVHAPGPRQKELHPSSSRKGRPKFVLVLEPLPHADPIRSLRWILKSALRQHGMRCVGIEAADGEKVTPILPLKEAS
jgi:hypothetical protein